ncbi:HNH endonuclease [Agarivorans sp. TSD2052]|uniref:HNH endonuclease n=1 Tax=Agarivorans sp. TSD2052 TaxID=2937286 RepID=UPI00200D2557|nr:HNH endonuclease [Agarivorans sp. TSD2052]UPW20107.1 HNH endonuclease [Agarivorans sp. TSD2052]
MSKESRTSFVNRVMGLNLGATQGKYSYCNDTKKQVLFSLDLSNGEDSDLILSPNWAPKGYAHSLKHIDKVINEGYELFIFKTRTRQNNKGQTVADGFEPSIEKRELVVDGDEFRAVPLEVSYEIFEKSFREKVNQSSTSSAELRRKRLKTATLKPKKRMVLTAVYDRNPDVVAEVLYNAKGICGGCSSLAPFDRKSDGSPYLEVHHKKPLAKGGDDSVVNAIALCPNCHRKAHYG